MKVLVTLLLLGAALLVGPAGARARGSEEEEDDDATEGAVRLVTDFEGVVEHRAANDTALGNRVESAAVKAEAPFIDRRNHLMSELAELANTTSTPRRKGLDELRQLHHDFDGVDREQRQALRASMDTVEEEVRRQGREDTKRVESLARDARQKMDSLVRSGVPIHHVRSLESRVDRAVDTTRDISEEFQRRVAERARGHVDYLDYTEGAYMQQAAAFRTQLNQATLLLQEQLAAAERLRDHTSLVTAPTLTCFALCGLAASAIVAILAQRRWIAGPLQSPLLLP
jgi:hypothetical protein